MIARFFAWLKSLVQKSPLSNKTVQVPGPVLTAPELAVRPIDYSAYVIDGRTGQKHTPYTLQTMGFPLPKGWDWQEWARVAGVVDPTTHDNRDKKVEPQESRQYVSEASLDMAGFREALLNVPGSLKVTSGERFVLTFTHGTQSKGYITAVANGLNIGHGPDWPLAPGNYDISFTGEAPAVRIAVKIRPAQ